MIRSLGALVIMAAASGCGGAGDGNHAPPEAVAAARIGENTADGRVPMDTLLRRFQAASSLVTSFRTTSSTREALTRRYLDALARFDTSSLREMHITRAEYAYLYFPSSTMMAPPYELPPDVAWMLHASESNKGVASVLRRFGGQDLELQSVRCPGDPLREGANIVWRDCVVRYRGEGTAQQERPLFAAIIEHDGRFKFFSYATAM